MDWSNEPYVKVYTRETDDDLALSWEARALWDRLMAKFDRSGVVETKRGGRGLAAITRMPAEVVERVLPELLEDGRLVEVDDGYMAPNFIAAQEASKSDKLRQRESRERRRSRNLDTAVTDRDASVTNRDQTSRDVTLCSADPDPDPVHSSATHARAIPGSTEPRPAPSRASGSEAADLAARRALGDEVWRELAAVRGRVAAALEVELRPLHPQDQGRTALAMRIREAESVDRARADCTHVLAVREAEALFKAETKWLSGSMFEERGWRTALAASLAEAKRRAPARAAAYPPDLRVVKHDDADDMPPIRPALRTKTT